MMDNYNNFADEWYALNQASDSLRKIGRKYGVSHKLVSRVLKKNNYPIKIWHDNSFKDITGQRFGRITAIRAIGKNENGDYIWEAVCDCRPEYPFPVPGTDLRRGRKKHCGCDFPRKRDLTGKKFGYLTVIEDSRRRDNGHVMWKARCVCSKMVYVSYGDLTSGHTQSCGCQRPRGEDHPNWSGGNEVKLYLRAQLREWKKESLAQSNNKCVVSGETEMLEIHHIYKPFIEIFYEALDICKLPQYEKVSDYEKVELEKLVNTFVRLNYNYGLGVAITRDLHNRFHSEYGVNGSVDDFNIFLYKILS